MTVFASIIGGSLALLAFALMALVIWAAWLNYGPPPGGGEA